VKENCHKTIYSQRGNKMFPTWEYLSDEVHELGPLVALGGRIAIGMNLLGDTTAAPAAAIVTFLMKSLLSIGVTATILCKDNEIHVSYQEMMMQNVLGMAGASPKLLVLGNLK
jgi:hypothetical protein